MITCRMNEKKGCVKKRILINTYHHHGTRMRMCHKNSRKNCLVAMKMRKKTIMKVFRCYLMVVENKTQKILYCFLSKNYWCDLYANK